MVTTSKKSCSVRLLHYKILVTNAHRALSSHHKIPEARVKELTETLKTFYNVEDVTEDMINEAAKIDPRLVGWIT